MCADFLAFEFAHFLIFGVSMLYVLTAVVASSRLHTTSITWARIANTDTETVLQQVRFFWCPVRCVDLCVDAHANVHALRVQVEKQIAEGHGSATDFQPFLRSMWSVNAVNVW